MARALSAASGLSYQEIVENIQQVNTAHGTIEYTAMVQEMPCFQKLPPREIQAMIRIVIESKKAAMAELNKPFEEIALMLETLRFNRLIILALSDAPKNLAYLRLKNAGLLPYFDQIIGTESPPDDKFDPRFHMENKPFLVPTTSAVEKKPYTYLEDPLKIGRQRIGQEYFLLGNSLHSDQGLARNYGMTFFHSNWDRGTEQDRQILLQFAPKTALEIDGTPSTQPAVQTRPGFEKIEVNSPRDVLEYLREHGQIN
jgi:FMN phosphatase YigB (HAD superfamily)